MRILIVLLFLPLIALAQQKPSDAMVQGFVAELEAQRNAAGTRAASLAGALEEAKAALKAEQDRHAETRKLCGKPCEKEEAKK